MSMSEYPEDIQEAVHEATSFVESDGMRGGGHSWESIEVAVAEAIKQERKRCGELAYAHALYNPACEGAVALHIDIMKGKRA